jgi:hypothetical protein
MPEGEIGLTIARLKPRLQQHDANKAAFSDGLSVEQDQQGTGDHGNLDCSKRFIRVSGLMNIVPYLEVLLDRIDAGR